MMNGLRANADRREETGMTTIREIAQLAAKESKRYRGATRFDESDLVRAGDAVARAVLQAFEAALQAKLTPALNTGTALDMLVLVGEAYREALQQFEEAK
jgi:hypothetical protein